MRMREFFDHHLMGKPAPDWWAEGIPHLKMDDHLKNRKAVTRALPKEFAACGFCKQMQGPQAAAEDTDGNPGLSQGRGPDSTRP